MNKWVQKSIELATSHGYLDKLSKIYPINISVARDISFEEKEKIKNVLKKKDAKELIF